MPGEVSPGNVLPGAGLKFRALRRGGRTRVSRTHGSKDFWLAALRADGAAFLHAVSEPGALEANVPSCPDWTVADLVRHLGAVYRRYRVNTGTGDADQPWPALIIPDDAPQGSDEQVVGWYGGELAQLDAHLDALDPDAPAWNWAPQTRHAGFWHRRAAHETAVHRWDAQLSTSLAEPLESKLAGDTVAEVLDTFLAAGRRRSPSELSGLVHLIASDLGQEWYVRLRGERVSLLDTDTLLDDDSHPARATASATASDLALFLWGRINVDLVDCAGDTDLLKALRIS
jgi:uncharacterized protein (TIGR03083 family)